MASPQGSAERFEQLRLKAEALIGRQSRGATDLPTEFLELLHEIRVYQAELEIQNEELRRAQEELTDLESLYEDLYELAPCGYLTLTHTGIISRINLTGVALIGETRERILRNSLSRFIPDAYEPVFHEARKTAGHTGDSQSLEFPLHQTSGKEKWVRADIDADRSDAGEVRQWRVVLVDIGARRAAEAERNLLDKQLKQTQKMQSLGTMAGGIAHEFNNLLSIVLGNVELAMDMVPTDHPAQEYLHDGTEAVLRAKNVVAQLLTFTRMKVGARKSIDLGEAVRSSISMIRTTIPANIEIVDAIPTGLRPVWANPTQIQQVMINLCSNATAAMMEGGGQLTIRLANADITHADRHGPITIDPGRYVQLDVIDTGCGMAADVRSRLFEPYFTTKPIGKGTGMGLAIVHGIVDNHEGAIRVTDTPGGGSTFSLYLPETRAPIGGTAATSATRPIGFGRILFVDDEPGITKLGCSRLKRLGYTVEAFTSSTEALERFAANPEVFDLVITDMAMPKLTGEQLSEKIQRYRQDIPIILCTGYSERVDPDKATQLGVNTVLIKPYSIDTLAHAIRRLIAGTDDTA